MATDDVVELGRLLGDDTRVRLLDALFDGRAYTVNELSRHVAMAPSTTSGHLAKLLDGGLVTMQAQGRHRYYRLHDADVATLLEGLFEFGAGRPVRRSSTVPTALAYARTCYDHLAGTIAVGLTECFLANRVLDETDGVLTMTDQGAAGLAALGIEPAVSGARRPRPLVRPCLDWSERRSHIAGAMPAALLSWLLAERWLHAKPTSRALEVSDRGRAGFFDAFGYRLP